MKEHVILFFNIKNMLLTILRK